MRYGLLQYFKGGSQASTEGEDKQGTVDLSPFGVSWRGDNRLQLAYCQLPHRFVED